MKRLILLVALFAAQIQMVTPAAPASGSNTCPASGAKRVNSSARWAVTVTITAADDNNGAVYIGGSDISSTTGVKLQAGDAFTLGSAGNANIWNLNQIWFACADANDGITWFIG